MAGRWAMAVAAVAVLGVVGCDQMGSAPTPADPAAWEEGFGVEGGEGEAPEASADGFAADVPAENGDRAGEYAYYLLALSWSPTYCANPRAAERDPVQCGAERPFSFIVHGLWPQNERGWPERCATTFAADVPGALVDDMLDLMPSPRLVEHQWDKHGVCTGEAPEAYFAKTRRLRERVRVPVEFERLSAPREVTAGEVEAAFLAANRGLDADEIVVTCDRRRIREVRICFSREGDFRACGADVSDRCGDRPLVMPPVRTRRVAAE